MVAFGDGVHIVAGPAGLAGGKGLVRILPGHGVDDLAGIGPQIKRRTGIRDRGCGRWEYQKAEKGGQQVSECRAETSIRYWFHRFISVYQGFLSDADRFS
jgi:hypothetical protein